MTLALQAGRVTEAGAHSVLHPASTQAVAIGRLYNVMLIFAVVVYVAVIVVAARAVWRRRATDAPSASPERDALAHRWIFVGASVTVAILFISLVYDLALGGSVTHRRTSEMLSIRLTGHQWWWEVEYEDPVPQQRVITANEVHVPVGRTVAFKLLSNDVIHSFWVPNLHGKRDLIPSRITDEWIQADQPGRYRGQCAEFCGTQHAHMALWVVADTPEQFEAWKQRQLQPAIEPSTPTTLAGRMVFEKYACVYCHTIRGTTAAGQVAPDLTHLASRFTIAAGTLPNTKGNLGGWILDPQNIKPGNHMATINMKSEELEPLLDYLETLQ
jgi:cytochrome c oxidase subunit II